MKSSSCSYFSWPPSILVEDTRVTVSKLLYCGPSFVHHPSAEIWPRMDLTSNHGDNMIERNNSSLVKKLISLRLFHIAHNKVHMPTKNCTLVFLTPFNYFLNKIGILVGRVKLKVTWTVSQTRWAKDIWKYVESFHLCHKSNIF
jgi:hypothetical protein